MTKERKAKVRKWTWASLIGALAAGLAACTRTEFRGSIGCGPSEIVDAAVKAGNLVICL